MSLENEFAVDIQDDDIRKAQAFYAAVRMIHVRLCKVANLNIHMKTHICWYANKIPSSVTRAFHAAIALFPLPRFALLPTIVTPDIFREISTETMHRQCHPRRSTVAKMAGNGVVSPSCRHYTETFC